MRLVCPFRRSFFVLLAVTGAALGPSSSYGANDTAATVVEAARQGDTNALRALLRNNTDVNTPAVDGTTALHWAAQRGDLEMVNLLIRRGANVQAANRYGVTPLRAACVEGSAAVVEALLKAGADANAVRPESGETPLMIAARSGHADVARALLAHGAKVDVTLAAFLDRPADRRVGAACCDAR